MPLTAPRLRARSRETCGPKQEEFIKHCFYTSGLYDDTASYTALSAELAKQEAGRPANRIFYLSIPPTVFVAVAQNAARCASSTTGARVQPSPALLSLSPSLSVCVLAPEVTRATLRAGYTRVIVEKPFGRDLESSRALGKGLAEALTEEQIYRCAHTHTHACATQSGCTVSCRR
jgi:glucose-6-phosphate 1-dehydrogenase